MLEIYSLLIICSLIAFVIHKYSYVSSNNTSYVFYKHYDVGKILFVILIIILVLFAGLRTRMNDTVAYINAFENKVASSVGEGLKSINWNLGANPLFQVYQVLLKSFVSQNGQILILMTSFLVVTSMVRFMLKFSTNFGFSMYLFIAFTVYAFTMAAMKQTAATAIAIWAVPLFIEKKRVKAIIIILVAMLVHPYVVIYFAAFFFANRGVWNKTIYITLALVIIASFSFTSIMTQILNIAESFGDVYDAKWFSAGTGVGMFRILSYTIVPIISFLFRNNIKKESNAIQDLFINLSVFAMGLSILSGFGGSVLIGRLPNYFDIFICLSLPYVIQFGDENFSKYKNVVVIVLMLAFVVFYQTYYNKYFAYMEHPITDPVYIRVSLFDVIFGS